MIVPQYIYIWNGGGVLGIYGYRSITGYSIVEFESICLDDTELSFLEGLILSPFIQYLYVSMRSSMCCTQFKRVSS